MESFYLALFSVDDFVNFSLFAIILYYFFQLRNMRDFFEFRYETARLECEQKLEAKAAAEKDAFVLELTAAEVRLVVHCLLN